MSAHAHGIEDDVSQIEVSRIETREGLAALTAEWTELLSRDRKVLPMLGPAFMLPWTDTAMANNGGLPNFLLARRGKALLGIFPLVRRRVRRFGLPTRVLEFPMYGTTPPFDIVLTESPEQVLDAFCRYLDADRNWDVVWLHRVPADSPVSSHLPGSAARSGISCRVLDAGPLLYVPLAASWPEFEKALERKRRNERHRMWRRLEEAGRVAFATYPGAIATLDLALEMAAGIVDRSWKLPGDAGTLQRQLMRDLSRRWDERGALIFRFLLLDDVPISYLQEICQGPGAYAINNAYDLAYRRFGPGQHVLADAIRDAHDCGRSVYEFLGDKDYLEQWSTARRDFNALCLARRSLASRALATLYVRARLEQTERAKVKSELTKQTRKSTAGRPASR
jgi:CelD/BcsL family acetyltransferase involved in cellulose biosynthesis